MRKHTEAVPGIRRKPLRVVGTCQDITIKRPCSSDIEHSRQFLAAITDNMAEGMIATDGAGNVAFTNAAAERSSAGRPTVFSESPSTPPAIFLPPRRVPLPAPGVPLELRVGRGRDAQDRPGHLHPQGRNIPPRGFQRFAAAHRAHHRSCDRLRRYERTGCRAARVERELEKLSWVGRIRDALDQGRFVLYAQPIVDLKTDLVVQHELLIRMVTPSGEIVFPDRFLPTAEEYGLISEIDRWVIGETARLAAEGHRVEFNLSAKSVVNPNMLHVVSSALEAHDAAPELVVCEITETALVRDTAAAEAFVQGLNDLGCQVALDDFGAGYGGFAYLKRLPVSYLKIDGEFVRDLPQEASSRHVVSAVVSLAEGLLFDHRGRSRRGRGHDRAAEGARRRPCPGLRRCISGARRGGTSWHATTLRGRPYGAG